MVVLSHASICKAKLTRGIPQRAMQMMKIARGNSTVTYVTIRQRRHAAVEVALLREKTHVVKSFGDAVLDQGEKTQN